MILILAGLFPVPQLRSLPLLLIEGNLGVLSQLRWRGVGAATCEGLLGGDSP